jgi:predicted dienelactone hydrolase
VTHTAGCRRIEVGEEAGAIPALVMYPADAPERIERFPPYTAEVAMDAPVAGGVHALVVISHGTGSWNLPHRRLAAHLARNGFVVALPVHPGDNREDRSLTDAPANLFARPRHLGAVIDHVLADPELGGALLPGRVAVIGHSMGGCTALALAGAIPTTLPREEPEGVPRALAVASDPRVAALVLLAPATAWFRERGALDAVAVPVLMMSGDRDEITTPWHAEVVENGLTAAAPLEHRVIAGAGHYSFLSPYPPEMIGPDFPASLDPDGFDRPAFHEEMEAGISEFLRRVL